MTRVNYQTRIDRVNHPPWGLLGGHSALGNQVGMRKKDGSLTLSLPTSIGEIAFNNIRVKGTEGSSFGSISIKGIDLTGTTITLGFH